MPKPITTLDHYDRAAAAARIAFNGHATTHWDDLPDRVRELWRGVVRAVVNQLPSPSYSAAPIPPDTKPV